MGVTVLAQPQPIYDYDIAGLYPPTTPPGFVWNQPDQFIRGVIGQQQWCPQDASTSVPRAIESNNSVGAGAGQDQALFKGIQAHRIFSTAGGRTNLRWGGIMIAPLVDGSDLAPGYANPSWRRVQRFQWGMAMDGGSVNAEGGMLYAANPGGIVGNVQWPSGAATIFFGGFGVIGNGTGDWQWASFGAGPPPTAPIELVDLSNFYADAEDWNSFEIVTISASGSRTASLILLINGGVALTRNWINAPALHPLGPDVGGVETYHYMPTFQSSGVAGDLFIGDFHYRCGRYLPDGRELTS